MSSKNFNAKLINKIFMFIFLLVEIWLSVLVVMFLFWKYVKLNILLIHMNKPKTMTNSKRREYIANYSQTFHIYKYL